MFLYKTVEVHTTVSVYRPAVYFNLKNVLVKS